MSLIVICGPTATGKSGLAISVAQHLGSVILSADSRQVYREFDIGTAKPSVAEQKLIPHYLIDICDPTETLTVADYQEKAQTLINSIASAPLSNSSTPVLVGGTGLYIKAIIKGLIIPRVAPDPTLRSQLQSLGQTQLYAMLQQVDPVAVQKIHPNDQVRTLRALEVYYVTGRPISQQQGENPPNYPILQIGLDCKGNHLTQRIQQRTQQMLAAGWLDEVKYLCDKYGQNLPLLETLGYQEMKQYIAGNLSLAEATELTVIHTRQFAKRQRTWFRADAQIEWFDSEVPDLFNQVLQRILNFKQLTENS